MNDIDALNKMDTLRYLDSNGDVVEGKVGVDINKLVFHDISGDPNIPTRARHYIYDKKTGKWREPTLKELIEFD